MGMDLLFLFVGYLRGIGRREEFDRMHGERHDNFCADESPLGELLSPTSLKAAKSITLSFKKLPICKDQ